MAMKLFFICVVLVGSSYAGSNEPVEREVKRGLDQSLLNLTVNQYVDEVLKKININIAKNQMDPLYIPNIIKGFEKKPFFITYSAKFILDNGTLDGLAGLHRVGNVNAIKDKNNKTLINAVVPVGFSHLQINYNYLTKIMNIGPRGGVRGEVHDLVLNMYMSINIEDPATPKATLTKFIIAKAGTYHIEFSGHILVDWLLSTLSELSANIFRIVTRMTVHCILNDGLTSSMDTVNDVLHEVPYSINNVNLRADFAVLVDTQVDELIVK